MVHNRKAPVISAGELQGQKIGYLESLRGLAAAQVLLLHILTAFFPAFVQFSPDQTIGDIIHGSPLFFFYDGYSAVYLFFVLSGFVLSSAFARQTHHPAATLSGRYVRLAIPAFCAVFLSLAVKIVFDSPNLQAGAIIGSSWLSNLWAPETGIGFFFKDALFNATIAGYREVSLGARMGFEASLDPLSKAYVSPLWTLSVELHGSFLVFLLVWLRARSLMAWIIVLAMVSFFFGRTHYLAFIIGHLFALGHGRQVMTTARKELLALILVLVGIFLCVNQERRLLPLFQAVCDAEIPGMLGCTYHVQKLAGAMFVFAGVLQSVLLIRALSSKPLVLIGKFSFPIYLAHWPVIFGPASWLIVWLGADFGAFNAALVASIFTLIGSLLVAMLLLRVDMFAVDFARYVRGRSARSGNSSPSRAER
jgi:peptidoglycan/LPS O-acetylase OafA/YrhL